MRCDRFTLERLPPSSAAMVRRAKATQKLHRPTEHGPSLIDEQPQQSSIAMAQSFDYAHYIWLEYISESIKTRPHKNPRGILPTMGDMGSAHGLLCAFCHRAFGGWNHFYDLIFMVRFCVPADSIGTVYGRAPTAQRCTLLFTLVWLLRPIVC